MMTPKTRQLRKLFADKIEDYLVDNPTTYVLGRRRWGARGLAERMTHNASIGKTYTSAQPIRYACRELGIAPHWRALRKVLAHGVD